MPLSSERCLLLTSLLKCFFMEHTLNITQFSYSFVSSCSVSMHIYIYMYIYICIIMCTCLVKLHVITTFKLSSSKEGFIFSSYKIFNI